MTAENPTITTERFIGTWTSTQTNNGRLVAELVSVAQETNRRPDIYSFKVQSGLLLDPETGRPVLDFIAPGVEYDIAEELQIWADENNQGLAFWISPKLDGVYPCNKVLIHQLEVAPDGSKSIYNTAILFDGKLEDPKTLRQTLFTRPDYEETIADIFSWIESVSKTSINNSPVQQTTYEQAIIYADQIQSGVDPRMIIENMRVSGFLGEHSISCPNDKQSFSEFTGDRANTINLSGAENQYDSSTFSCPGCKGKIESGKGITECPHCGLTKEQAGSQCD